MHQKPYWISTVAAKETLAVAEEFHGEIVKIDYDQFEEDDGVELDGSLRVY